AGLSIDSLTHQGNTYTLSGVGSAGASILNASWGLSNYTVNLGNLLGPVNVEDVPLRGIVDTFTINGTQGADYITKTEGNPYTRGLNPIISWGPAVWNGNQASSSNPNAEVLSIIGGDPFDLPQLTINGGAGRDYIKDPGDTPPTLLGGPDDDTIVLANA